MGLFVASDMCAKRRTRPVRHARDLPFRTEHISLDIVCQPAQTDAEEQCWLNCTAQKKERRTQQKNTSPAYILHMRGYFLSKMDAYLFAPLRISPYASERRTGLAPGTTRLQQPRYCTLVMCARSSEVLPEVVYFLSSRALPRAVSYPLARADGHSASM